MNNVLEIKNYTKVYSGNKKAVDSLNLTVKAGEIHAFIGHNGAGKTTTIRAVVGIMDFDEGEILINGHSVKNEPVKCKSITAYIPDNPDLYGYVHACKNDFYRNKPYNDAVSHQSDNWLYSHAAVKHYLCRIRTSADF